MSRIRRNVIPFVRRFCKGGPSAVPARQRRSVGRMPAIRAALIAVAIGIGVGLATTWFSPSCLASPASDGRNAIVGVASVAKDEFAMPWDWHHGVQQVADTKKPTQPPPATPPQNCAIKGNISSKGERIYHVPGGRYYGATQINPGKGERWFCSESEAIQAGWRRSKR